VWCYPDAGRNYPGWHFTADATGCAAFLDALAELESAPTGEHRTLRVLPVTKKILAVPNNRNAAARSANSLRLSIDHWRPSRFEITEHDGSSVPSESTSCAITWQGFRKDAGMNRWFPTESDRGRLR
jgi:hypothetical protein